MITKSATTLLKSAEADEDQLELLANYLQNGIYQPITLGTVHPSTLDRIREERKRFRYKDVVLAKRNIRHLHERRILADNYSPEKVVSIFRNVMNNPNTEFRWSNHYSIENPDPVLVVPSIDDPERVDFVPIYENHKRIGALSAYDPRADELDRRVLAYNPNACKKSHS